MSSPEQQLAALGITLPPAPAPAASYVPFVRSGTLLYTAGQLPSVEGQLAATGLVGGDVDLVTAISCAHICAINVIAQAKAALGSLDAVAQVVKLTVFVASAPGFAEQHLVANGASELLAEVFGDAGRHARSAVGVASLPLGAPVEVDAIFEVNS